MSFRFQTFPIYNKLRELNKELYLLAQKFPSLEMNGISSQLRRASSSIILNLAEGSSKNSDPELNRFLTISVGSIGEIVSILDLCFDLKYIDSLTHDKYLLKCEEIAKQLYGFKRSLKPKS